MTKEIKTLDSKKNVNDFASDVKSIALGWFNAMTLEEQFYLAIEHNELISGSKTRHPSTLTDIEIEAIYLARS